MKIKLIFLIFVLLFLSSCTNSKPLTGYWVGSMEMNGKTVDLSIDFTTSNGTFTSNDLMLLEEPISNLKFENKNISFNIMLDVEMMFEGTVDNEKISGTVRIQGGPPNMKISFNLEKKSGTVPSKSYIVEKFIVKSKDVNLSAEIFKPKTKELHPALVLLHGSSMNLKNQYSFYADFFANLGFEVLIFDKRGNGGSTGNYATSRYDDLVEDAVACLEVMKNRESVDKNKIGLWGYSQGAMLLPMVVTKTNIPAFLIAKSPEIFGATEGGAYSDSLRIINLGNTPDNARIAAESYRIVEKMIRDGSSYKEVENFINQNAQKYSFMNQTGLYGNITINKNEFEGYYWKDRTVNFYTYWEKLKTSTLALFGEDDEILNAAKNESIIKRFNKVNIETKMFSRASHNLKKAFNPRKYPDFDWPRAVPEYLDFMKKWLEKEITK
jgi:dienelactone hydrolase